MKHLLILFLCFSYVLSQKACVLSVNVFDDYASQNVKLVIPKKMTLNDNTIEVVLSKPNLPSGFMVPVIFDLVKFDGTLSPEVIGGYPKSTITIQEKGTYHFNVKVNLVYKSSCGGIQFSNLLTQDITFRVQ
jgi:hypothetical protein